MTLQELDKEIKHKQSELDKLNKQRTELIDSLNITNEELKKYSGKVMRYHIQKKSGDQYIYIFIGTIQKLYDDKLHFNNSYYITTPDNGEFSASYKFEFGTITWSITLEQLKDFKEVIPDKPINQLTDFINHIKQCWKCNDKFINDYSWHTMNELPTENCDMMLMQYYDCCNYLTGYYYADKQEFEFTNDDGKDERISLSEKTPFSCWMQIPDCSYILYQNFI